MRIFAFFILFMSLFAGGADCMAAYYSQIDKAAKSLSVELGQTPQSIVENLINPAYTDMQKARVLAAFVAYQLQKNGYVYKELNKASTRAQEVKITPSYNVLQTRVGTALDYALLYRQLCRLAGLEAEAISGYAGMNVQKPYRGNAKLQTIHHLLKQNGMITDYSMQRYESVWNVVKVDGEWILVDTYWLVGGEKGNFVATDIDSERKMNRFLSRREANPLSLSELTRGKTLNEDYFNAKPRNFIKTHYPFESEWQLLPNPVSLNRFLK